MELTNVGSACLLQGYPTLLGIGPDGAQMSLTAGHGTFFGDLVPVNLAPQQQGELLLGTVDACAALNQPNAASNQANLGASTYKDVVIVLPNGGLVAVPGLTLQTACGLTESQLGTQPLPPMSPAPPPPAGSPGTLVPVVRLPVVARSKTVMNYTVILRNPSRVPVALHRCPDYTEGIGTSIKVIQRTYQLNCAPARPIQPGHAKVFAMEMFIPRVPRPSIARAFPGPITVKFSWVLDVEGALYTGEALRLST